MAKEITLRRCKNLMCRRAIWSYQFKYGSGLYCDEFCSSEDRVNTRTKRRKTIMKGLVKHVVTLDNKYVYDGKNNNIQIDIRL